MALGPPKSTLPDYPMGDGPRGAQLFDTDQDVLVSDGAPDALILEFCGMLVPKSAAKKYKKSKNGLIKDEVERI